MTGFNSTNELRNVDIEKLLKNPGMKPRKNPIHRRFVDERDDVFRKFQIKNETYYEKGNHNLVYRNDDFVIRISRKIFYLENEDFSCNKIDNDTYIDYDIKAEDERILLKAIKADLSPRVYYFGNIKVQENLHRFAVFEAYSYPLSKFIKYGKHRKMLEMDGYYKNMDEIYDDIVYQICDLLDKTLELDIVYYDIKPENVVIKMNNNERLIVKLIDWDSDFCIEEKWVNEDNNRECAKYLMLLTISGFMLRYYNCNIFYKKIEELYEPTMQNTINKLLFDMDNEFIYILVHYFYRCFGMNEYERDNFNVKDNEFSERMEKQILSMIRKCKNMYRN